MPYVSGPGRAVDRLRRRVCLQRYPAQCRTHLTEPISKNTENMMEEGQKTFRYDTFGDEVFWGDALHLHQAIEGERFGGVGPGVSPATALAVGLKVDVDALPIR